MNPHSAKIIDLYRQHASAWVRLRSTNLVEKPWLDKFLAVAPAAPRDKLTAHV